MSERRRPARLFACLALATLCVASTTVAKASPTAVTANDAYTFKNVKMGGTGFVSGIVFSQAQKDLAYARTDVGGAYRWNGATRTWTPLLDWVGWDDWGYQGVAAIAPSPTNANKVWAAVGMYTNGVDPNNGAVLRSADKGATWQRTVLPFTLGGNMNGRTMGERLGVDPNNDSVVYLGAPTGNGLWRSTDGGATFAKVTAFPHSGDDPDTPGVTEDPGLVWVVFDRSSGTVNGATRTVYVGVADRSDPVYRSTDGGASWSPVAGTPTGFLPHKGVVDPVNHKLYLSTSDTTGPFSGGKGDVWKLDTTTGEWTRISPIPSTSGDDYFGYSGLTVDRTHPNTIMVGTQVSWWPDGIIWRSTDGGATWTRVWDWGSWPDRTLRYRIDTTPTPWMTLGQVSNPPVLSPALGQVISSMEIDPFDSNRMLFNGNPGVAGTNNLTAWDNGGTITITPTVDGLEEGATTGLVKPPGGPLLSAMGDVGGFRHDNLDAAPKSVFTNPVFTTTRGIDFAERNPKVIVRAGDFTDADRPGDSHAAFSTDGGTTWFQGTEPSGVNTGGTIAASADGGRFVWAPGDTGQPVVNSVGFGTTWTASTGVPANAIVASDRVNAKRFYAFSNGTFYTSANGGSSFTATTATGLPASNWNVTVKALPGREGEIWVSGGATWTEYGLWRSTNGGATFIRVSTVEQADNIGFGKAAPGRTNPALYTYARIAGKRGVFRSDDTGATWVRVNDDNHQWGAANAAITGDPAIYGRVYLAGYGRGTLYGDRIPPR